LREGPIRHHAGGTTRFADAQRTLELADHQGWVIHLDGDKGVFGGQLQRGLPTTQLGIRVGAVHLETERVASDLLTAASKDAALLCLALAPARDFDLCPMGGIEPESRPRERQQYENCERQCDKPRPPARRRGTM
jgi:hypothetical protein